MSYNNSIPNVTDFLAISQKQLLANYQSIYNSFSQNHVALGTATQGMHNSLTLRPQPDDPTTSPGESALYQKLVSGTPQIFFRSNSDQTPIQMTNSNLNTSIGDTQSSFLPGPFTIYMGFLSNVSSPTTVTLIPASTLIYVGLSIIATPSSPTVVFEAIPTNISGNQFTIQFSPSITSPIPTVYYMAIGK